MVRLERDDSRTLFMVDTGIRLIDAFIARATGPMWFRFVLQPTMGLIYAIRDGRKDAREGRPPYFWAIFRDANERRELLHDGWKAMFRVIVLGVVMDVIYQIVEIGAFRPMELVLIVLALAFVPYLLLRGPMNRLFSHAGAPRRVGAP